MKQSIRRVLIASNHPLFAEGLISLLRDKAGEDLEIIAVVSNVEQAHQLLEKEQPDLIVVDYDDEALNREEFLARFVEGQHQLRLVLLSLHSNGEALIYDRRTLSATQIDAWLERWDLNATSAKKSTKARNAKLRSNLWRKDMKHLLIAGVLVLVVTALLIVGLETVRLLPVQASLQAQPIDDLFSLEFKVIAFLFSLIVVFMVYSIVVFRRKPGDLSDAKHIEGNTRLEVLWTAAPLATVLVFAYLGSQALGETMRADPKPLEVNVIGQQWAWRFEYPQYGITSDRLILPVNKQAVLHLWSEDVIHSFWVPEFRVKQDALPGGEANARDLRVTPTLTGEFKLRCAELCGRLHATMLANVIVMTTADFDAWMAEQLGLSQDPVARGEKWAKEFGCLACHSVDGSPLVGPSWLGIFGKTVRSTDGTELIVDENYLIQSVLDPNAYIVEGFLPNIMPQNYADRLTLEQIQDIVAYIQSLK